MKHCCSKERLFVCFEGTTESYETMNQMEQIIVFVVVGVAMVLFLGVFIVFVCRCNKRCPTYKYSMALFEQHTPRGGDIPLPTMTVKRTVTDPCAPHLPPYSVQQWTDDTCSETPPPKYAFVYELVPLSRPPSYQSIEDNEPRNS